jgi:beta-glucanase (GH16 family)
LKNRLFKKSNLILAMIAILIVLSCAQKEEDLPVSNQESLFETSPSFYDEFDGSSLDTSKWTIDKEKYRTDEVQCYTMDTKNVNVTGGNLNLTALKETTSYTCVNRTVTDQRNYTSGSIRTVDAINNLGYGKYEARIKVPVGYGFFTAFWTLGFGGGWPGNGEVDIMEHVNQNYGDSGSSQKLEDFVRGTSHWINGDGNNESNPRMSSPTLDLSQYHVFKVERTPSSIKWYVDDIQYAELDISNNTNGSDELHANHAILFNFALGGWPPSPDSSTSFPATMYVDWVRFYKYSPPLQ